MLIYTRVEDLIKVGTLFNKKSIKMFVLEMR